MTLEEILAACPKVKASYAVPGGLVCHAEAVLVSDIWAAFTERDSDCTCICGHNCKTYVGDGSKHWCVNPHCGQFNVPCDTPNGHR